MKVAIVTTSLETPKNFISIYKNQLKYDHNDVHYYWVGDLNARPIQRVRSDLIKTIPEENFTLFTYNDQLKWIKKTFDKDSYDQYCSVFQVSNYQRRIIGFLKAVQDGSDMIIAVDSDNFAIDEEDFIGSHIRSLGSHDNSMFVYPNRGYVNLLDFLEKNISSNVYVRGIPLYLRTYTDYSIDFKPSNVGVHIGLWYQDPDIEAISRIAYPDLKINRKDTVPLQFCLDKNINTSMCLQNISFLSKFLIAQYEFPMNEMIDGIPLGRYDDIWAGYVCKKILDQFNYNMSFGSPIALHDRLPHDIQKDFLNEFWGMYINLLFYPQITSIELEEKDNIIDCFAELVSKLSEKIRFSTPSIRNYFDRIWMQMFLWKEMVEVIQDEYRD